MSQYAVVETGSKQYRTEVNQVLDVELLNVPEGTSEVTLDKVLLVRDGEKIEVGAPCVANAKVVCDYLGEVRGKKVINFRYRRRKAYQRKKGHRQNYSRLRVKAIELGA